MTFCEKIIDAPKVDTVRRIAASLDVDLTELVSPEEILGGFTARKPQKKCTINLCNVLPTKNQTCHVYLSPEEEELLKDIAHKGNSNSAKKILHANILLLTNECYP